MPPRRPDSSSTIRIDAIREFNRFYVPRMGFLNHSWTRILSLSEAKVIHEIYIRPATTASEIGKLIRIDNGYLSRVLRKFERNGLIQRKRMIHDGRQRQITLTAKGRKIYDRWAKIARDNVADVVKHMSEEDQQVMIDAMQRIVQMIVSSDVKNPPLHYISSE